ncbi:MAG: hypothetical protein IJU23_01135, partial [Proteobacteria bacterium]|nr:hypothetical protein [Pseudomonadota bacterium]
MKYRMMQCCLMAALMFLPATGMAQDSAAQAPAGAPAATNAADATAQATESEDKAADDADIPKSIYDDPTLKPRDVYNLAVKKLSEGKYDEAVEGFMIARDQAAFDNELRFSSAYNLGHAYAQKAEAAGDPNNLDEAALQGVVEDLGLSASWFRDAVKQRPSLDRATGNLEIVLKRLMDARDIMAQKFNTLERQLEEILATERELRENARVLSERIDAANSGSDPMNFQNDFKTLASIQREALTQTNLTSENLDSQLAALQGKAEDQRSQEESFRIFQLQSASPLLETARQAMAGARRQMRDLSMSDSLRLTNKAFNYVRQAREQLENPLSVLNHIAEDESGFVRIASAKYMFQDPELLAKYKEEKQIEDVKEPSWLNNDLLSDNQIDTLIRTNRLIAFLKNVTEAAAQQQAQGQQPQDPQAEAAQTQMEQIKEALPLIEEAASLMQQVTQNLEANDYKESIKNASQSLEKLALAMERFADLKHLVELTYASHLQLEPVVRGEVPGDTTTLLSRAQQREILSAGLAINRDRIERLSTLLSKEAAKINQAQPGQQPPSEEQIAQMQKVFEQAEILRKTASDAMDRMIQTVSTPTIKAPVDGDAADNADNAVTIDETVAPETLEKAIWGELTEDNEIAKKSLEQLRIIFFTVIEHIQELYKQQTETMDRTTDAASGTDEEKAMKVPPVIERQHTHEAMAGELAEILKKQAEQIEQQGAGQQPQQGGPDPAEMAQRYREASSELDAAATVMRQVQTDLSASEPMFTESIEEQKTALEHIAKALELLQPP